MFLDHKDQQSQSRNKEEFGSLDQALLMCKIIDPYNSRSAQVACAASKKQKMIKKTAREVMSSK